MKLVFGEGLGFGSPKCLMGMHSFGSLARWFFYNATIPFCNNEVVATTPLKMTFKVATLNFKHIGFLEFYGK
jgi:hypothetical protein